jgi:hypothetical protein
MVDGRAIPGTPRKEARRAMSTMAVEDDAATAKSDERIET